MKDMKNMKQHPCVALVAAIGVLCLFFLAWFIIYGCSWSTIQSPQCTAVVRTRVNNPPNEFIGASAGIIIYKPRVQNQQSSSARIKLVNGAHTIEAGWMVNPDVFGDDNPHLYTRFTGKGKSCINTQCEGFVQVPNKCGGLGLSPPYSVAGGTLRVWDIFIQKREDNNWWLFLTTEKVAIGYWPGKLFKELAESASMVEWGGEVSNPSLIYPPPEMGNGNKARYDTSYSASFIQLSTVDKNGPQNNPNATEKATTCVGPYRVLDAGYQGHDFGRIIFYG